MSALTLRKSKVRAHRRPWVLRGPLAESSARSRPSRKPADSCAR